MNLEREVRSLKKVLKDSRVNLSGLCKKIDRPGLSRASLVNKLNKDHVCNLDEEDVRVIKKALIEFSSDILKAVK